MAVLSNGVIGGGLSYLFTRQGIGMAHGAEILSLLSLPQTIYFLWSPITDFWIKRRTWLMLAATTGGIGLAIVFQIPNLASPAAVTLLFLSACFAQLVVAACGGIMGSLRSEAVRRRASSFYQAGSLAFGAVGIFVVASLAERMSQGHLGWIDCGHGCCAVAGCFGSAQTGRHHRRKREREFLSASAASSRSPSSAGKHCLTSLS